MAPSAQVPVDDVSPAAQKIVNGSGENGVATKPKLEELAKTDFVLRAFRCLIADLCEQFKGGHPG